MVTFIVVVKVQHLLESQLSVGTIGNKIGVFCIQKRQYINTFEKLYICRETKSNNEISDQYTQQPNDIFKATIHDVLYDDHSHTQTSSVLLWPVCSEDPTLLHT